MKVTFQCRRGEVIHHYKVFIIIGGYGNSVFALQLCFDEIDYVCDFKRTNTVALGGCGGIKIILVSLSLFFFVLHQFSLRLAMLSLGVCAMPVMKESCISLITFHFKWICLKF